MALDAVGLSVQRHAIHAIIGPNGAGKTTLFNIVTGFYTADRGIVRFDGAAIDRLSPSIIARLGAARTFQNLRLIGDMPALENVLIGAHRRMHCGPAGAALGLDRKEERHTRRDALELLARFGLAQRAGEPARALPYGDQRRLEIARALASAPKLLLLDEPAAGMNRPEAEALAVLIRDIRREFGVTIVLIEHDMNFVMSLCDHVSVLDFGRVIASGEPQAVQRDEAVARAYLGAATQTPGDRAWIS
jgi:ABC-type branched-subunit amino acid transport system ATPase component